MEEEKDLEDTEEEEKDSEESEELNNKEESEEHDGESEDLNEILNSGDFFQDLGIFNPLNLILQPDETRRLSQTQTSSPAQTKEPENLEDSLSEVFRERGERQGEYTPSKSYESSTRSYETEEDRKERASAIVPTLQEISDLGQNAFSEFQRQMPFQVPTDWRTSREGQEEFENFENEQEKYKESDRQRDSPPFQQSQQRTKRRITKVL